MKNLVEKISFTVRRFFRFRAPNYGSVYAFPIGLWLTLFFVVPIAIIVAFSFLAKNLYGGVNLVFSFQAYIDLFNISFVKVTLNTIVISFFATLITILIALPCGYYMARSNHKTFLLFLVIIPFWTNFLIRIYAWIAILGNNGFINEFLKMSGFFDNALIHGFLTQLGFNGKYIEFLYNPAAVVLVLVYTYLPYAILPLYSTIEKFDFSLLEAARDLGANKLGAIRKVLMPNIKSGLLTAVLFTFIPIFGAYAVPLLVGGLESYMLGNIIADQITKARNWPLAASFSLVITLVTTLALMLLLRVNSKGSSVTPAEGAVSQVGKE